MKWKSLDLSSFSSLKLIFNFATHEAVLPAVKSAQVAFSLL